MHHNKSMYITNVEKEGPFLKIWGQIDKKSSLDVEKALLQASAPFDEGQFIMKPTSLEVGVLCCAKYMDEKYYRSRITSIALLSDGMVEVNFLDYGNKDTVPAVNLRSLEYFNPSFISLPPLSSPFILAETVCIGGEWNDRIIEQISKEIRYIETNYLVVAQAVKYYFIKIFVRDIDLGLHLVKQNLMQHTSVQTQEAVLLAMIPRAPHPVASTNHSLLQYKSFTLEPNSQHEVYVSYITDGPCHFSVQLKKYESSLVQLMREINSISLKPLEELPIPGTVCLAKCIEDNHICRAVVTSEVDSQYKLFYVDFGNTELVPPENLYQIAFKYVIPKIMAIRLSLAGLEKPSMTLEMQCAFKQFVDNRLLMMEVLPGTKKLALPKCRMWDPDTNIDVIEVLNRAAKCAYPDPIALHKGFTQLIKVSFVFSCNRFYVQLKSKEQELSQLMIDLQTYCNSNQTSFLDKVKVGQPCCAQFSFDQQWYRSLITEINGNVAKVRYIDFGNEEDVPVNVLKVIEGEYLTILRPQAIECSLNGYQNMSEDQERDNMLEELILEQEFTMRVIDSINNKTLVDLMDSANTTVTALLLDSIIARSKVQTAPIIENRYDNHDKRSSSREDRSDDDRSQKSYFQHDDRRPPRTQNWKDKTDDCISWRQNTRKRSDSNSNESTESWRQDNKGFRNRKENDWNERSPNGNFRKEKGGFRGRKDYSTDTERPYKPRNQDGEQSWNQEKFRNKDKNWGGSNSKTGSRFENNNQDFKNQDGEQSWNQAKSKNKEKNWEGSNTRTDSSYENNNQDFKKKFNRETNDWVGKEQNNSDWGGNNQNKGFRSRNKMVNDNQSSSAGGWGENKNFNDRNTSTDDWGANKERKFGDRNREYRDNDRDFKKKHFRKEGSEISSSGSEKSFGKGARTSSRNDSRPPRHDKRFDNKKLDNSWNVSAVPVIMDSAPNDAKFKEIDVNGRQERITISWFHNPSSFFCQLVESQESFKKLMQEVQEAYKHRKPGLSVQGAPAIALFPEDNVLYRARIIEVTDNQYKVYYVDFGNVSVVDKVWPIDNKFMEMPMQAIPSGLSGIEPINGNWPNPDNFSKYFEKEYLDCDFLMVDNGKYWINLSSENENVCQQLVNDGLAKYSELSTMEFEISLLVGQQFHAMIQIINSLSDLKILLQSGITVNCSIHNLSSATETYEEILKENLEKILIVYADNLVDDRLEITLYDLSGNKLNIIIPDEGAFDTVDPFCPYLVTKSTIEGFVSHINENSIVIQPTECSKNIEYFVEQMYEYYENLPPDNPLIPEEEFVYATKSSDGNWYRGKVTTFDDDKATVIYLDYGNSEEVSFSCLRELISQFIEWDIMAVTVSVKVPTADFLNQEVTALVYYSDAGLEGEIKVIAEHEHVIPEITPETKNVTNVSSQQFSETTSEPLQEASEISIPQSVETTGIGTGNGESTSSDIETGNSTSDGTSVILSHIDSPSDFYIQLVNSQDSINELQLKLQEDIKIMAQLDSASVGGLCAAPYSIDQQWYRSQILDADDDITTVRFIDYGNTDVIDNKSTKIKTLPPELLSLEEYATRCRLKIKPIEEEWSKGANERFEELTSVENIKVEFIDQDEKTNYVELYSNGDNVKDILIQENLAVLDNVVLEGKLTGFISHINSPSEFWVQLESCCVELEWIAEQLSNAGSFPDLEDLTPGCLCAAMFPDDEMWYRARILSNTVAGLEVLFLDYGNSCICSNLKQLPEHLVLAPPLAQKCSLQKPEGLLSWSAEASQKFNELSAEGQTVFTVKKLTTGETSLVELLVDGEDVSSKLLPTTDNGFVNNIESLERFSISKEGVVSEEKYKLEKISGTDYNEECIEKFVEINNEGKTQYEVEYLPEYTVRLYLNGRDIRNSLKEVLHKEKISQSLSLTTTTQAENESALSAVTDQTTNQFKKTTDLDSCNNDIALQKLENENTSESTVEMVDSIVANIINEALSANTINLELKQEANEGNSVLYREENEEKTDVEENSPIKEIECDTLVTMNEDQPTNFGDNTSGEFDTNVSNESLDTSNISLVNNIPDKSEDNVEENIFEPAINLTKGEVITSVVENVICENEFDSSKTTGLEDSSSRNTANLQEISASQISQGLELAQAYIEQKAVEEQSANSPEAKVVTLQVETHGNIPTNEGKSTDENAEYSVNEIDVHQESVEPETKGHSEPEPCIKKSEESKIDKNSFKIEFHENILASFPAPSTIENVKVVTKLSPTKVVPKSQDSIE